MATITPTVVADYSWDNASTFTWVSDTGDLKTWAESQILDVALGVDENIPVAEHLVKHPSKEGQEAFSFLEVASKEWTISRNFSELLEIAETYTDIINFLMNVVESFSVSELDAKSVTLTPFNESFGIADAIVKDAGLGLTESLAVNEDFARAVTFYREILESVNIGEVCGKDVVRTPFEESFGISDAISKEAGKNVSEAMAVIDVIGRTISFERTYAETLNVDESMAKAVSLPVEESFALYEEYRRNANNVISDIHVGTGIITELEFQQMLSRLSGVGYENFNRIMTGDYSYQKAIVKVALSSLNTDRPQLDSLSLDVDVPDVADRGSSAVVVSGSTISFNRSYYTPPEVNVSLKSGSTAVRAEITAITNTDFTVILYDSGGTSVAGTITWASNGF